MADDKGKTDHMYGMLGCGNDMKKRKVKEKKEELVVEVVGGRLR